MKQETFIINRDGQLEKWRTYKPVIKRGIYRAIDLAFFEPYENLQKLTTKR